MNEELQIITGDIELGASQGEDRVPTFTMAVYNGGKIRPKGFKEDVVVDVKGIEARAKVPVRVEHDADRVIGHTEEVNVSSTNITAAGILSRDNDDQREIVKAAKSKFPFQASFGLNNLKARRVPPGEAVFVNGKNQEGPFVLVTSSKLQEISVVSNGADDESETQIAAKAGDTVEVEVTNANTEHIPMDKENKDEVETQAPAKVEATASTQDTPQVILQARKEQTRKDDISRIAEKSLEAGADIDQMEQLLDNALNNKSISASQFEHDCILIQRPRTRTRKGEPQADGKVIEAALCMSGGLEGLDRAFDERTLNAAADSFRHGLGLQEVMYNTARRNGFDGSSRDVKGLLEHTFAPGRLQASSGFSTMSLPGIFSNVANKFLLEGFFAVEQTWDRISAKRNARDFKEMTSYRLVDGFTFEKVPAGGKLAHGEVGEEVYRNKVDTYGKMFAITRQDIINDDLNALSQVPRGIGRGGAVKLNQVFWDTFLDDAAFFNAGNANLLTGTANAFSVDGLSALDNMFREQTDANGNPLLLTPRILLVPSALRIAALQLINSTELRGGTGKQPTYNPHAGAYDIVESQYLNKVSKTGYYLLANPGELPVIEAAFLNGQRTPTVESADANFDTLGVQMRGFWDWGIAHVDHRAGVKATGVAE